MMFRSIRSRLALSFAGIALIAAVALGAVLLVILQNYYSNLERGYLAENAKTVGDAVARMISNNMPHDEVQSQVEGLAFLIQTRIQVFDSNNTLLYDSGSPQNVGINLNVIRPALSVRDVSSVPNGTPIVSVAPGIPFGFGFNAEATTTTARSKLVVTVPIQNANEPMEIRLSEGPAYGSVILRSVALGWALASAIAIVLAAGIGSYISRRISAPILALTNVTGRMAQGKLSSRANVESRDEIGQLASSFNEMADQVESTVNTLRQFVADAAHELRTPLAVLSTNLELMLDKKNAAGRVNFVAEAKATVQRLKMLNSNLLDLSQLEAHGPADRDAMIDLAELLQARNEIYASQAEQAGLVFEQDLLPAPVFIRGDVSEIMRAIDNLVDNACKFTSPDGTIRVALSEKEEHAMISVTDTGVGIPEDELPQLFNRFHRGRNVSSYPGSGLGLAIVKAIVTAHKGRVDVQSAGEGTGSKFSIRLPVVSSQDS